MSGPTRQHAARDVGVQVGARLLNLLLGLFVTALVVRTLGDSRFGQWMSLLTIFQLASFMTSLGLEAVAVREAAAHPEQADEWIAALLVTRLGLSVPVALGALGALLYAQESHAMLLAGLVLLVEFPLGVGASLQVVHQIRIRNAVPMAVLTLNSVVWAVGVALVALLGGGLIALAVAFAATAAFTSVVQSLLALRLISLRQLPSGRTMRRLLRVGGPLGLSGVLITAYARIDQIIVLKVSGAAAAGLYGAAYRVLEQAHFVPISLLTTLTPLIAASWQSDRARALRFVNLASELLTATALGALAFSLVAAAPLLGAVFGQEFVPAADALPILAAAFVFICFGYLTSNMLLVLDQSHRLLGVSVVGLVVNVVGNLLLVPAHGYLAAAWMTLITEVVVVGLTVRYVVRGLGPGAVSVGNLLRIVLAAAVLAGSLLLARAVGAPLLLLMLQAAVVYPVLLAVLRAPTVKELRQVISGKVSGAA